MDEWTKHKIWKLKIPLTNNQKRNYDTSYYGNKTQPLFRKLQPLADRVLVKRAPKEVQTAGGIILPSDSGKDPNEGEVVAVGKGMVDVSGNLHAIDLKAGDKVLLPEYGGTKIKLEDSEVFMFRETDILGKFD